MGNLLTSPRLHSSQRVKPMPSDIASRDAAQTRMRQFRRLLVRLRVSPWTVPAVLLSGWSVVVLCLARVADPWIVALMAMPLVLRPCWRCFAGGPIGVISMPEASDRCGATQARPFPAALLLPGDAFDTDQFQVLGRRVAGRSMAQGITRHLVAGEELVVLVSSHNEGQRLRTLLEPLLPSGARLRLVTGFHRESFQAVGALHVPDPGLAKWELLRSGQPANAFSITGVIHTLCSEAVFNSVAELESAPLQPWDALVCTSKAGRTVVQRLMEHRHQALERRFGTSLPKPLGRSCP